MNSLGTPSLQEKNLHVALVLKERGWILEKMAQRLIEYLIEFNITAEISPVPLQAADINHWMIYYDVGDKFLTKSTIAITHVDRPAKLHVLKKRLEKADFGICMSRMTAQQLVLSGIPRKKLCYILPGHDEDIKPRRIVIGLTTQIRPDGAKREALLLKAAQSMRLDAFHFSIVGPRWEKIIPVLESSGATVDYVAGGANNEEHHRIVLERLNTFDYYLYMGWDEGSMGLLDALALGLPTIVTPQGFHIDLNAGITHPIWDASDLCAVFEEISRLRQQRIDSVAGLTWREYARKHAIVWRALGNNNLASVTHQLDANRVYQTSLAGSLQEAKRHGLFPYPQKYTFVSLMSDLYMLIEFYTGGWFGRSLLYRIYSYLRNWSRNSRKT